MLIIFTWFTETEVIHLIFKWSSWTHSAFVSRSTDLTSSAPKSRNGECLFVEEGVDGRRWRSHMRSTVGNCPHDSYKLLSIYGLTSSNIWRIQILDLYPHSNAPPQMSRSTELWFNACWKEKLFASSSCAWISLVNNSGAGRNSVLQGRQSAETCRRPNCWAFICIFLEN